MYEHQVEHKKILVHTPYYSIIFMIAIMRTNNLIEE